MSLLHICKYLNLCVITRILNFLLFVTFYTFDIFNKYNHVQEFSGIFCAAGTYLLSVSDTGLPNRSFNVCIV